MHSAFREQAQVQFIENDHFEAKKINDNLDDIFGSPNGEFIGSKVSRAMLDTAIAITNAELLGSVKPYLKAFGYETAKRADRWMQYRSAYQQDTVNIGSDVSSDEASIARFTFETALRRGDPYFVELFSTLDEIRSHFDRNDAVIDNPLKLERKLIINSLLNAMDDLVDYQGVPIMPNIQHEYVRIGAVGLDQDENYTMSNFIVERFKNPKSNTYYLDLFQPGHPYGQGSSMSLTIDEKKSGFRTRAYTESGREMVLKANNAYKAFETILKYDPSIKPVFKREPYKPKIS